MAKKAIIQAKNLCKTYSSGMEQFHAIKNVDLEIYEGDFTVIMGNSGSGKSTLLYLLSGLDSVTAGEVYFNGQRIDRFSEKQLADFRSKKIGYVYQNINLVPDLTVLDNISLPGLIAGFPKKMVRKKAEALLKAMDIEKQKNRLSAQTSGGQQQRAAIARALVNSPQVMFADEPTGSLNFEQGVAVLDILTRLNQQGQTVVMITHDMKAACRADRLFFIKDGKIDGVLQFDKYTAAELPEREEVIFSYLTRTGS